jgi:hypothetical protein
MRSRFILLAGLLIVAALSSAAPAAATTFCVPSFSPSCPDNGTNVAEANLEAAMTSNATDGIADRVLVGPHTYTDSQTLEPAGTDPLEVIGSGPTRTVITSSSNGNVFVVNLNSGNRATTMRSLTIVVPSSFPDGLGAGLQSENGKFTRVNIDVRNPGSDAAPSLVGDNLFRDCRIFASVGGTVDRGLKTNSVGNTGSLKIIDTTINRASTAVFAADSEVPVTIKNSRISRPDSFGIVGSDGAEVSVVNSIVESGGQSAFLVETSNAGGATDATAIIRNSTFVATGDASKAPVRVDIGSGLGSRSATVLVADSILRGFDNTWEVNVPFGPGIGTADLTFLDSNFPATGLPVNSPFVDVSDPGNFNANPRFAGSGNYRLRPGSPSIDAGGKGKSAPVADFSGAGRPRDGDGDGIAIRDQGAFERADTFAPKITRLKAIRLKSGGIRIRYRLSEAARVRFSLKPLPARSGEKQIKAPQLRKKARRGLNTLVINRGRLSAGRYLVKLSARDRFKNKSSKTARTR